MCRLSLICMSEMVHRRLVQLQMQDVTVLLPFTKDERNKAFVYSWRITAIIFVDGNGNRRT